VDLVRVILQVLLLLFVVIISQHISCTTYRAQRGRHWRKEGGGPGLVGDPGRAAFPFQDNVKGCTKEDCLGEGRRDRNDCLKTCKVFIDDSTEYMLGKERREVLGY